MQKRLCGREQEFGVKILPVPRYRDWEKWDLWTEKYTGRFLDQIPKVAACLRLDNHFWLANGGLIYLDAEVLEASTAEHLAGSLDGVLQEKALERILNKAAKRAAALLGLDYFSLYKNNVGCRSDLTDIFDEVTYGSHHNYSYLEKKKTAIFRILRSYLPAMLPLSGNGHVYPLPSGKIGFCFSQRANHVILVRGHNTTENRALINLREQSLTDPDSGLQRLHLISRDATRCEFQTWLVDTITHLIIRLGEEGWKIPKGFWLESPVTALHRLNFSLSLAAWVLTTEKKSLDLVDYQYLFLRAARQLSPLSPTEKKGLEEWERVLELLKARAFEKLVGELDWATKLYLIKNKMAKYNFGLNDLRAWKIDMGYHDISSDPKRSWFALLEQEGYIKHLVTQDQIKQAMATPPQNTRAKARGELVQRHCRGRLIKEMDWQGAETNRESFHFGKRYNPFSTELIREDSDPENPEIRF